MFVLGIQSNLNPSHINLPGILPSNITSMPLMMNTPNQDQKNPQWQQNPMMSMGGNPMGPQQGLNPGQIPQNAMMPQMGQGQMPGGPMGMGMPMPMMPNKGDRGFMGMPNPGGNFIHPANVAQNEQGGYRK